MGNTERTTSAFDSTTFDAEVSIHVDRKVGSASISPSGRDVALASTDGLDIIDLDSPLNPPRHLRHGLPWLVADVQWSPFPVRDYWVVSTANQKALVWNLNMSGDGPQGAIEHILHGHTRAITDINFSASHPDMLATCAVDGFVHCWDLRRPRQPVHTFVDWFGGATQVKYNRQDPHILASSHDRWLRVWDIRKGAKPVRSINAHESKIYGLDWDRARATSLVTCSLDKSIKLWDYNIAADEPERIIRTSFPIWRARFTPFGFGVLAMSQNTPGHVHLYDTRLQYGEPKDANAQEVKTFCHHGQSKVKEFLWRSRGGVTDDDCDDREFQLVTWGEDHELRLTPINDDTLATIGYSRGQRVRQNLNVMRKSAAYRTYRAVDHNSSRATSLTALNSGLGAGIRVSALSAGMKTRQSSHGSRFSGVSQTPMMKGKSRYRSNDAHQQPIDWMSGIKIQRQDKIGKRPTLGGNSLHASLALEAEDWDSSESLQDEIIRVSTQLPKVAFDTVDMDNKSIEVSMNGPWGSNHDSIHIKVKIVFPAQYPEGRPATFTITKTSSLSQGQHNQIRKALRDIAGRCAQSKKGCLQPVLCYLIGEASVENSTAFLETDTDEEREDVIPGDRTAMEVESSSEEESEQLTNSSILLSQDLDSNATAAILGNMSRNAKVPLPNLCGATFARNGKLVCFFPPQTEKYRTLYDRAELEDASGSRGHVLDGFQRFQHTSATMSRPKSAIPRLGTKPLSDESEDSEDSPSSSSDSSNPPNSRLALHGYWRMRRRRTTVRSPTMLSHKSSTAGTGHVTNTSRSRATKSMVKLEDLSDLLPSKQELAREYINFGSGPHVCRHNAKVAARNGYQELADVWRYAELLLYNEVPLELLEQKDLDPVFIMSKRKSWRTNAESDSDSAIDMTFDQPKQVKVTGRVKWGDSPLARQLIRDLFAYYVKLADTQMLAMLSCVFSEPPTVEAPTADEKPLPTMPRTPLSMKTPAFSLEYFPTNEAVWTNQLRVPRAASNSPHLATPKSMFGSAGSAVDVWTGEPATLPVAEPSSLRMFYSRTDSYAGDHSLSVSPENSRYLRRKGSSIGDAISALAKPFSSTYSSYSTDAETHILQRKRTDPLESILSTSLTRGTLRGLPSVRESSARSITNPDEVTRSHDDVDNAPAQITVLTINQGEFDDEGCMSIPLLAAPDAHLFECYRYLYADLLFSWQCPLARLEILKFNQLRDEMLDPTNPNYRSFAASLQSQDSNTRQTREAGSLNPLVLGRSTSMIHGGEGGLDTAGYCLRHETRLRNRGTALAGGATGMCERCGIVQRHLRCVICMQPISGLFQPCLSCGCASHQHCLQDYLDQGGGTACPGSCDCDCATTASLVVVESLEAMAADMEKQKGPEHETREQTSWTQRISAHTSMGRGLSTASALSRKLNAYSRTREGRHELGERRKYGYGIGTRGG